jgi:hypothetical protein
VSERTERARVGRPGARVGKFSYSYFRRSTHVLQPDGIKPPKIELFSAAQALSVAQGEKTTENSLIFGGLAIFGGSCLNSQRPKIDRRK